MQSIQPIPRERLGISYATRGVARGFRVLWTVVSWPLVLVLAAFEPFVRGILYAFALLGTLSALFIRYVGHRADVPLLTVFAVALGCTATVACYRALLRLLASSAGR
jgi:hypothetical protein